MNPLNRQHLIFVRPSAGSEVVEVVRQNILFHRPLRRLFQNRKIRFPRQHGNGGVPAYQRQKVGGVRAHGQHVGIQPALQSLAHQGFLNAEQICDADAADPGVSIALGRDFIQCGRIDEVIFDQRFDAVFQPFRTVENASHLLRGGGKQAGQDHLVEIGEKFREIPVNVGRDAPFELSLFSPGERAADTGRAGDAAL